MKPIRIIDVVKAVGAIDYTSANRFAEITSVVFDSRKAAPDSLFVPLQGETDGHDYVQSAIKNGATATLWSREAGEAPEDIAVILVDDTLEALQKLAEAYLNMIQPKVVAITGSNGKTTTKDMTAAVLSARFRVHKTEGNYNNEIGMPMTILEMPEDTQVLVLEMGMSNFGEISLLSRLARPDVAIITLIGDSHLEFLGSRRGIAKAKLEILEGLKPEGTFIYPGDEPLIAEELPQENTFRLLTFGTEQTDAVNAYDIVPGKTRTTFHVNLDPNVDLEIPVLGVYNVRNALAALAAAQVLGMTIAEMKEALATFQLTANRTQWLDGVNGSQLLNDAYNASPTSMTAVLRSFANLPREGKKIAVLGDIRELGERSAEMHAALATEISPATFDQVYLYGTEMTALYENLKSAFPEGTLYHYVGEKAPLIDKLKAELQEADQVLIKSSFGTDLLAVVAALRV
jgi:UDP-N-acetylmuramoyl-tripeptide--D-alanyl-D-alanine ligase